MKKARADLRHRWRCFRRRFDDELGDAEILGAQGHIERRRRRSPVGCTHVAHDADNYSISLTGKAQRPSDRVVRADVRPHHSESRFAQHSYRGIARNFGCRHMATRQHPHAHRVDEATRDLPSGRLPQSGTQRAHPAGAADRVDIGASRRNDTGRRAQCIDDLQCLMESCASLHPARPTQVDAVEAVRLEAEIRHRQDRKTSNGHGRPSDEHDAQGRFHDQQTATAPRPPRPCRGTAALEHTQDVHARDSPAGIRPGDRSAGNRREERKHQNACVPDGGGVAAEDGWQNRARRCLSPVDDQQRDSRAGEREQGGLDESGPHQPPRRRSESDLRGGQMFARSVAVPASGCRGWHRQSPAPVTRRRQSATRSSCTRSNRTDRSGARCMRVG